MNLETALFLNAIEAASKAGQEFNSITYTGKLVPSDFMQVHGNLDKDGFSVYMRNRYVDNNGDVHFNKPPKNYCFHAIERMIQTNYGAVEINRVIFKNEKPA